MSISLAGKRHESYFLNHLKLYWIRAEILHEGDVIRRRAARKTHFFRDAGFISSFLTHQMYMSDDFHCPNHVNVSCMDRCDIMRVIVHRCIYFVRKVHIGLPFKSCCSLLAALSLTKTLLFICLYQLPQAFKLVSCVLCKLKVPKLK